MPDSETVDRLLTTTEVAERLRVDIETVRRMARSGRLPGFLLSDKAGWRFRTSDIEAFIEGQFRRKRGE